MTKCSHSPCAYVYELPSCCRIRRQSMGDRSFVNTRCGYHLLQSASNDPTGIICGVSRLHTKS